MRERKFYVLIHDKKEWSVNVYMLQRVALDALNQAGDDGFEAHYIEAMAVKMKGPDLPNGFRWDF